MQQKKVRLVIRWSKIKLFRGDNYIDGQEVADLYNQFKDSLGDLIKRELDEVTAFKQKIDNFQRSIVWLYYMD
jgi:hypothetical protein